MADIIYTSLNGADKPTFDAPLGQILVDIDRTAKILGRKFEQRTTPRGNGWVFIGISDLNTSDFGYVLIQDEGVDLPKQHTINFTGSGVTATDVGDKTEVNIPSSGGGMNILTYIGL